MSVLHIEQLELPFVRHSTTSREAAHSMETVADKTRHRVLMLLRRSYDPLTDEQMQQRLGMNPSTQRPRRIELYRMGLIVKHPEKGATASGRRADRWMAA